MKEKKPYPLERKIVVALRKLSRSWPEKSQCLKDAKAGRNALNKQLYRCEGCKKDDLPKELIRIDHIDPIGKEPRKVVLYSENWVPTWDQYIRRLFCERSNLQALCLDCHDLKTRAEKQMQKTSV